MQIVGAMLALTFAVALLLLGLFLFGPEVARITHQVFSQGLGLKDAAILSFFITTALLVIFAAFAGDGLLGEIQFMLASYFAFFVIFWLMTAWIF